MAGHSKFKNIMYRKGAQDKKRSALFSKLSRDITIAAKAGVTKDVPPGAVVSGYPARPHREDLRRQAAMERVEEALEQLKSLQVRIEALESRDRN